MMDVRLKNLKCPNWIKPRYTTAKKLRRSAEQVYAYDYEHRFHPEKIPAGYERCGGNLILSTKLTEEPGSRECIPALEVKVICDVCGQACLGQNLAYEEDWITRLAAEALDARGNDYYRDAEPKGGNLEPDDIRDQARAVGIR